MKITPEITIARHDAGYRPPVEDRMCCRYCGAVRSNTQLFARYYCQRHGFYANSKGVCPSWGKEPYTPPTQKPKSPFTQKELF